MGRACLASFQAWVSITAEFVRYSADWAENLFLLFTCSSFWCWYCTLFWGVEALEDKLLFLNYVTQAVLSWLLRVAFCYHEFYDSSLHLMYYFSHCIFWFLCISMILPKCTLFSWLGFTVVLLSRNIHFSCKNLLGWGWKRESKKEGKKKPLRFSSIYSFIQSKWWFQWPEIDSWKLELSSVLFNINGSAMSTLYTRLQG